MGQSDTHQGKSTNLVMCLAEGRRGERQTFELGARESERQKTLDIRKQEEEEEGDEGEEETEAANSGVSSALLCGGYDKKQLKLLNWLDDKAGE